MQTITRWSGKTGAFHPMSIDRCAAGCRMAAPHTASGRRARNGVPRDTTMASVCFYFQIHQPFRLRRYSVFDTDRHYFDEYKNGEILRKISTKCYLPANKMMLEVIKQHEGRFRVSYSVSGAALEQLQQHAPEVIDSFHQLNQTGCVEFLQETYYHSLSFLYSREEFRAQVELHRNLIRKLFGQEPRVFRNTE